MTDSPRPTAKAQTETIAQKRERIEEITERLENGEVSLERAADLHAEGKELIESLEADLDLGEGSVTVRE